MSDIWLFNNAGGIIVFIILVLIGLLIIYQIIFQLYVYFSSLCYKFEKRHVFITGGSSGLGLCVAKRIVKEGGKVTIIARREDLLKQAKADIISYSGDSLSTARIQYFSADVTSEKSIRNAVNSAEDKFGPIDMLITCHGYAAPKYVFETSMKESRNMMEVNYFGTLHCIRAVVPGMMKRNSGELVFTTSQLAVCGFIGYSHYSGTKYALRGLIEVMRNELSSYNIKIRAAYPPGMNTPGLEKENKTKPVECNDIESNETIYEADFCADCLLTSIKRDERHISCGDFGCNMLIRGSVAISDRNNSVADIFFLPIIGIVCVVYRYLWNSIVQKKIYHLNREELFTGLEMEN